MVASFKNVTTEPVFTIRKECDRCGNLLYFSDTVITDVETDADGKVLHSSIGCPICGHVIVLYSIKGQPPDEIASKAKDDVEEALGPQ